MISLLFTWFVFGTATIRAGDAPASKPTPHATQAVPRSDYVAIKMTRCDGSGDRFVEMVVAEHKLRMLVDTGSSVTVLHTAAAGRLGLLLSEDAPARVLGGTLSVSLAHIGRYRIGDLAGGFQQVGVADLKAIVDKKQTGSARFDGILGMDILDSHAARLDFAADTLHLRSPFADAMARLAGRWVCTAGETPDGPIEADRCAAITYDFDGDRTRFKSRLADDQSYFIALESETPARLVEYQDVTPVGGKRRVSCKYIVYKQSGDTLTILTQYTGDRPASWDGIPKDFKPTADFVVMHFKRVAPTATLPAMPAATPPPASPVVPKP